MCKETSSSKVNTDLFILDDDKVIDLIRSLDLFPPLKDYGVTLYYQERAREKKSPEALDILRRQSLPPKKILWGQVPFIMKRTNNIVVRQMNRIKTREQQLMFKNTHVVLERR